MGGRDERLAPALLPNRPGGYDETERTMTTDAATTEDREIDLRAYLQMLRRRWWLALLAVLATVAATLALTLSQQKSYEARTRLFVGQQSISQSEAQFAQGLTQTSLALVQSYSTAITTTPIAQDVIARLNLKIKPEDLLKHVSASPVTNTQIISVRADDPSPTNAAYIANAFALSFIQGLNRIDPGTGGGPAVQVSVLEPASPPTAPANPKPKRDGAVGLALGLLFAVGVVLLSERLDTTLTGRDSAEEASGYRVIAIVPHIKTPRGSLVNPAGTPAGEAYRTLRTSVQYAADDRRIKVLAVTSPEASDGKTSTAFNLAVAFAEAGVDAYLVEADMRNPSIARNLNLPQKSGLSSCLAGETPLDDVILRSSRPHLYLVPAGPRTDKAPELFGGARMSGILNELKQRARIVIVDTPPILGVSDPVALAPIVDGYLLVVRGGKTRSEHLRESVRLLSGVGATIFGVVLNDLSRTEGVGYGYGYGYGYGAQGQPVQAHDETHAFERPAPPPPPRRARAGGVRASDQQDNGSQRQPRKPRPARAAGTEESPPPPKRTPRRPAALPRDDEQAAYDDESLDDFEAEEELDVGSNEAPEPEPRSGTRHEGPL